jgi:DNA modification methylase
MVGIPWRVAFALQADGWYLRSDIIWSKPNPMPESVTDRPTKSHEYIFLLTKKARYFYDADAVREAGTSIYRSTDFIPKSLKDKNSIGRTSATGASPNNRSDEERTGRNRRTVWEIATQPFPAAHFATFPEALVEPCIKAGTSERGCCSVCGAPWVRVVEKVGEYTTQWGCNHSEARLSLQGVSRRDVSKEKMMISVKNTVDWQPSCTCAADTVPCIVLDPFGGSGTVAKVARDLNRRAILIELNEDYIKIAKERLRLNEQLEVFA